MAGIDLSGPEPLRRAGAHVGELIDEVERSFGRGQKRCDRRQWQLASGPGA